MLIPIKKTEIPPITDYKYKDIREEIISFINSDNEAAEVVYNPDKFATIDLWRNTYRMVAGQFSGIRAIQRKERLFILKYDVPFYQMG